MQQQLTHIDLFSGIGGFSLASAWAGFETVVFCEKDKYCHKILNKHWHDVPIIEDIHEFKGEQYSGATLLTGGVPCQPASVAGRQRGTKDDRWLWPETLRVIRESKPKWVILENVRGLVSLNGGMEFDNLLTELEALQYQTRAFIIPACGVGALHRRERVWIVANTDSTGLAQRRQDSVVQPRQGRLGCSVSSGGQLERDPNTYVAYTESIHSNVGDKKAQDDGIRQQGQFKTRECSRDGTVFHANDSGCIEQRRNITIQPELTAAKRSDWWSVEPNVGKLANGVPDRVAKLRALGNAIVPQVAYQIIEKIAMIELGMATTEDS